MKALVDALACVEIPQWKERMDGVHSVLLLVDTALSAEPLAHRQQEAELRSLKKSLAIAKNKVGRYRGMTDYHGLECESLASFLCNKIEFLFLSPQ